MLVSAADLVEDINLFKGQDVLLKYHVYTDGDMDTDETITGWTLAWRLVTDPADEVSAPVLSKTTPSGIVIATPYASVALTAAEMDTLEAGQTYHAQLWRNEAGNVYPLTGLSPFTPQAKPPLS